MYNELKKDLLKLYSGKPQKSYTLKGVNGLTADDIKNLLSYCHLYEREGEIAEGWKERVKSTKMAEVLVRYDMW